MVNLQKTDPIAQDNRKFLWMIWKYINPPSTTQIQAIWVSAARGYDTEPFKTLVAVAKKHKVQQIVIESNFGDGMFAKLLAPHLAQAGVKAECIDVRHHTMKEMRILDTLEPVIGSHRLIVDPSVITNDDDTIQDYEWGIRFHKSLFHQMTHICRERGALKFDDRVDVLAMLVAHFIDIMDQNQRKTELDRHQEWLNEQTKGWHKTPLNSKTYGGSSTSWNKNI